MLKVIVADDEKRICRLICMLADWSSLGIEVVATASNGLEALEAIEAYRPDILVTDIHMPGCNGLELIEKSKAIQQQELMTSLKKLGERCRRADVHRTSAFYCSSPRYKNNPNPSPAEIRFGLFFFGAGNRTRTCTLLAVEPKGDVTLVKVYDHEKRTPRHRQSIITSGCSYTLAHNFKSCAFCKFSSFDAFIYGLLDHSDNLIAFFSLFCNRNNQFF